MHVPTYLLALHVHGPCSPPLNSGVRNTQPFTSILKLVSNRSCFLQSNPLLSVNWVHTQSNIKKIQRTSKLIEFVFNGKLNERKCACPCNFLSLSNSDNNWQIYNFFLFLVSGQQLAWLFLSHASGLARICTRCDRQAELCTDKVGVANSIGALCMPAACWTWWCRGL